MNELFSAASAVTLLLMLMSVGYAMGRGGWMGTSEKNFLGKFIMSIAVPCNCLTGLLNRLDRAMLLSAGGLLLCGFLTVLASFFLSAVVAQLLRLPRNRKGVFIAMAALSNTLFIGLPITAQLFGDASVPYVMFYFLPNTILLQTLGVMMVEQSGTVKQGRTAFDFLKDLLTKPPVVAVTVSIVLLVLNLRPPELVMTFAEYISNTVSPLALIYCGYILYEVGIKNLRFSRGIPTMLVLRLIAAPLLCIGICHLFGVSGLARDVFVVESALPVVTQVTVMAGTFGADEKYAASGACISTLGCVITIPILMLLMG